MSTALHQRFEALGQLLAANRHWWQPAVFANDPPWVNEQPELAEALLQLDDAKLKQLESDPASSARWLARWLPQIEPLDGLIAAVTDSPLAPPLAMAERHGRDIRGRKWQQILHFAAMVEHDYANEGLLVEWCAGKSHLGRLLGRRHQRPVRSIEWQESLCDQARDLAARDAVTLQAVHADVLSEPTSTLLDGARQVTALHACGDLHRRLLEALPEQTCIEAADIAPCCYHLSADEHYRPFSRLGEAADLGLDRQQLRLVIQQVVVANPTMVERSRQLMVWRLGFDALQRQWRDCDTYLPTPSVPHRTLHAGFAAFVADMAEYHGLSVPAATDYDEAFNIGRRRLARSRRLALLRHRFRRALECWLVLDRGVFLQEAGFSVRVGRFCPFHITPRNLMIQARR